MKKFTAFVIFLAICISAASAQCTNQIMHTSGSMYVNGVEVTVTSSGFFDFNSGYCPNTIPYFIGYSYDSAYSGTGSYTFSFSPPVSGATLNFSGISMAEGHYELVRLFVNGDHYPILAPGSPNGCDPMAVLTPEGDIEACPNCSVSGWMGTDIPGPIYSLTVQDTVFIGSPAGAIFSLFICDGSVNINKYNPEARYTFSPNPFVSETVLKFPQVDRKATFILYNLNGQRVKKIDHVTGTQLTVNRDGLQPGIYHFMLRTDQKIIESGKLVVK